MKYLRIVKILLTFALLSGVCLQAEEDYDIQWVKQFGTSKADTLRSTTVDISGNIIAAGETNRGTIDGGIRGVGYDPIIVKYDTNGTLLWSTQFNTSVSELSTGVTTDSNNNIFVTGYISDTSYNNNDDIFLAKYDSNGTHLWSKQFGTLNSDVANSITVDSNDNIFITGFTTGALNGGIKSGGYDIFISKYDNDGLLMWTKQFGTTAEDVGKSITCDRDDNILVTGHTNGALNGGLHNGYKDIFVIKYTNNGALIWTKQSGTGSNDYGTDITTDTNNNVFITGDIYGSMFVSKYDTNGTLQWTNQLNITTYNDEYSIACDSSGNIFITEYVYGALNGQINSGLSDAFIIKYDNKGTLKWTKLFGTTEYENGQDIVADKSGNIFVVGDTSGTFNGEINNGGYDVFISKFSSPNTAPVAIATATPQIVILNGTTIALDASQSYDPDADNISFTWGWIEKPLNSTAAFSNVNSINPTFLADAKGSYTLYLDVTDTSNVTTRTEIVVIFNNIKPVADTSAYAPIVVGNSVNLDASASSDANGDTLTYSWSLVSKPSGSTTTISNNQNVQALLTADVDGTYILSLTVNDGSVNSDPVNVSIEAITVQTATIDLIEQTIRELLAMPDTSFSNKNHRKTLINKLNVVVRMLAGSEYQNAISKLQNDLLPKVDDYLNSTQANETDWITSAGDQSLIYTLIAKTIGYLQNDINQ